MADDQWKDPVNTFFSGFKNVFGQAVNSSLQDAMKLKDTVNGYIEEQSKKVTSDLNDYVDKVKGDSWKMYESWSYLPGDDSGSLLENPDVVLPVPAKVARHGYLCETHTVMSQGYLLAIHRIPAANKSGGPSKTVLLQHGLFGSSADWVLAGPGKALAYLLADAGYDVWMSNIRGNKYSRHHAWLKTNSKAYWNFSWHDVALADIPAVIDYIRKIKGEDTKITYVGHSMGTTILFVMLSMCPEYNDYLNAGFALAPVVFMSDFKSPLKKLAPYASKVAYMEMLYGSHEFLPMLPGAGKTTEGWQLNQIDETVCKNAIFYMCGEAEDQYNKEVLPAFLANLGAGTSWKTIVHYSQLVVSGKFRQFDYEKAHNQKVYGKDTPPEYDLSKITAPIKLFWAQNDLLSSEENVMKLRECLPDSTRMHMVCNPKFSHMDYIWGTDVCNLLNKEILKCCDCLE